jgi:AcrR family transcriptional regulator
VAAKRQYVLKARADAVERTRTRILAEARQALFTLPFEELTLPLVAERAGVTTQTVRNHFDSKEGLIVALTDAIGDELLENRRAAAPSDSASAAAVLATEYESYGHAVARLLAAAEHSPAMAAMAAHGRQEHLRWLEDTFADRLPDGRTPAGRNARRHTLAALYAATDVGTWRLLRLDLGHSQRLTTDVMRTLIDGALTST